jgi:hypothetical protein
MPSTIMLMHTPGEYGITAFIVLSCVIVIVKACVQSEFLNESESSPSDMAKPMKATPMLRVVVIVGALLIGAGALWSLFKK